MSDTPTLALSVCPKYRKHDAAVLAAEAAYKAAQAEEQHADGHLAHWRERATNVELAVREGHEPAAVREKVAEAEIAAQDAAASTVKAKLALADARAAREECRGAAEGQVCRHRTKAS